MPYNNLFYLLIRTEIKYRSQTTISSVYVVDFTVNTNGMLVPVSITFLFVAQFFAFRSAIQDNTEPTPPATHGQVVQAPMSWRMQPPALPMSSFSSSSHPLSTTATISDHETPLSHPTFSGHPSSQISRPSTLQSMPIIHQPPPSFQPASLHVSSVTPYTSSFSSNTAMVFGPPMGAPSGTGSSQKPNRRGRNQTLVVTRNQKLYLSIMIIILPKDVRTIIIITETLSVY